MSEHLIKFLLSELHVVRVRCSNPNCGVVIEVPIARLRKTFAKYECPSCKVAFCAAGDETPNWLMNLQDALEGLRQAEKQLQVQFVIPEKE